MDFWREVELELQDEEPQPGWSGLYDPWNGRRREYTSLDLCPASELYYNTEDSDYEDDVHTPGQREEESKEDKHEDSSRCPFTLRSPSPLNLALYTIFEEDGDEEEEEAKTIRSQGITKKRDEEDLDEEAPPRRRQRVKSC